jgi:hypothetical protein
VIPAVDRILSYLIMALLRRKSGKPASNDASGDGDSTSEESLDTGMPISSPHEEASFGFWVSVSFTVNYIMGCGFLGIPKVFTEAGLILSPIFIVIFGFLMNVTKDYLLEAMGNAEVLGNLSEIFGNVLQNPPSVSSNVSVASSSSMSNSMSSSLVEEDKKETTSSVVKSSSNSSDNAKIVQEVLIPSKENKLVTTSRKFEVTELFSFLMGPQSQFVYMILLSMYLYGSLWSYTSVFASSFSANVPLPFQVSSNSAPGTCIVGSDGCQSHFLFWLLVFALVAVPCACLELKEQVILQVTMFGARILVTLLLTGTVLAGYSCSDVTFAILPPNTHTPADTPLAAPSGLAALIPVCIYAFIFHHSVPILAQPVKNKRTLRSMFATAFGITGAAYVSIGFLVALYFGSTIDSQANLNWQTYVGCVSAPSSWGNATSSTCSNPSNWSQDCIPWESERPWYAKLIAFVVLIFPALDVCSAFPLNAATLGNNLMSSFLGESSSFEAALAKHESTFSSRSSPSQQAAAAASLSELDSLLASSSQSSSSSLGAGSSSGIASSSSSSSLENVNQTGNQVPFKTTSRPWHLRSSRHYRFTRICFRLLASVPPVIGAAFLSDLGAILTVTGTVGVGIAFLVPAALQLASYQRLKDVLIVTSRSILPSLGAASTPSSSSVKEIVKNALVEVKKPSLLQLLLGRPSQPETTLQESLSKSEKKQLDKLIEETPYVAVPSFFSQNIVVRSMFGIFSCVAVWVIVYTTVQVVKG